MGNHHGCQLQGRLLPVGSSRRLWVRTSPSSLAICSKHQTVPIAELQGLAQRYVPGKPSIAQKGGGCNEGNGEESLSEEH